MIYRDKEIEYQPSGVDMRGSPDCVTQDSVYAQDTGIPLLSQQLEADKAPTLYQLFSSYFDGKVSSDKEMVELIYTGFFLDSEWCYCVKSGVTFCWFTVSQKRFIKLGVMQFSEVSSKYSVGRFMKRLQYKVVKSGVNLSRLKYVVWSKDDLDDYFSEYVSSKDVLYLSSLFSTVNGLRGRSLVHVMHLLSHEISSTYRVNAESIVDCLNDSCLALRLTSNNGTLTCRQEYLKDYSSCTIPYDVSDKAYYGVVIDCEGKTGLDGSVYNGCREIGGLIFCSYKGVSQCLNTFSCDEVLLEETLSQMIKNFKEYSGIKRGIPVYTFGTSDKKMLESSCSKKGAKILSDRLVFKDCLPLIQEYVDRYRIRVDGKGTLSNIAKAVGVLSLFPKHKPLNDAKTLFNILACISYNTDYQIFK